MLADYLSLDLAEELGLNALPQEERDAVIQDMGSILGNRITNASLMRLNDEQQARLDDMLAVQGDDADIFSFFKQEIPGFELLVQEIIAVFKEEMLDVRSAVDTAMNL